MTKRHEVTERETRALQLRSEGRQFDEIAAELGYADASGAQRAFNRAMSKHQAVKVDAFQSYASAVLDELDREANAVLQSTNASDSDKLRAIAERRKNLEDRGKLIGFDRALERAERSLESTDGEDPRPGNGFSVVFNLDDVPMEVRPPLTLVRVLGQHEQTVAVRVDWHGPQALDVFAQDGLLKTGNTLCSADPADLGPLHEYLEQGAVIVDP